MEIFMRDYNLRYQTELPAFECIHRISHLPWKYRDEWGTDLWYKCEVISDTRLLVIFTGGQFRKAKRTQFFLDFVVERGNTLVIMSFYKEMFGLPPMTPLGDIDRFMNQKISAVRL